MKIEGLDAVVRDGIPYLDFYTVSQDRDGQEYSAHVSLSLRDLHGLIVQASTNKTRRKKRGPLRTNNARARARQFIEGTVVRRALNNGFEALHAD
jgi:hypothetical protein